MQKPDAPESGNKLEKSYTGYHPPSRANTYNAWSVPPRNFLSKANSENSTPFLNKANSDFTTAGRADSIKMSTFANDYPSYDMNRSDKRTSSVSTLQSRSRSKKLTGVSLASYYEKNKNIYPHKSKNQSSLNKNFNQQKLDKAMNQKPYIPDAFMSTKDSNRQPFIDLYIMDNVGLTTLEERDSNVFGQDGVNDIEEQRVSRIEERLTKFNDQQAQI